MPHASSPPAPSWLWNTSQRSGADTSPWPEAVQKGALCFHLNFHGEAQLTLASGRGLKLKPQTLVCAQGAVSAARLQTRDRHECLTLVFPHAWLADYLEEVVDQVPENIRRLVSPPFPPLCLPVRVLTPEDYAWARSLMMGCLSDAVRHMLDAARLADFLLRVLFSEAEGLQAPQPAVSRSERVSRERIERVKNQILQHLDDSHDLESLAAAAGCSPHYLSRTFAQLNGTPLMLWIRRTRIERAADLIASGRCNVSEAALEVGYSSFSHFSRAFQEEKGVSPSKWISHLSENQVP